jgi:hypothetical protein
LPVSLIPVMQALPVSLTKKMHASPVYYQ